MTRYCAYDEHPIAGRDIQCRVPDSQSGYTTPIKQYCYCKYYLQGIVYPLRV